MNESAPELLRIEDALWISQHDRRLRRDLNLPVVHRELLDWLRDDRQWVSAYGRQWVSLLDDLAAARQASGPSLSAYLADEPDRVWGVFRECRRELAARNTRGAPEEAIRRRLERASAKLDQLLAEPKARQAAWQDLVDAASYDDALGAAHRLLGIVSYQGLDPKRVFQELRAIVNDEPNTIAAARGLGPPDNREPSGLSEAELLELAQDQLMRPPRVADMTYWLRYSLARLTAPPVLRLGDSVSLYSDEWLAGTLERGPYDELPPELATEDGRKHLDWMTSPRGSRENAEAGKELPHVLVRVHLGEVRLADAVAIARETAELLVSLAALQGEDASIWILTDDHASFVDGRPSGSSMATPPVFQPTLDQQTAIEDDRTPTAITEWSESLAPHLPLRDPELRHAGQLVLWLRRTQQVWGPGRLVLCDRIFEQVAGWAGLSDRGRFIHDYLRLGWAISRVTNEITNCWAGVFNARSTFFKEAEISDEAWKEIQSDPEIELELINGGWRINARGVLWRSEFLLERVQPGSKIHERLQRLIDRTRTGKRAADWIEGLLDDFDVLERRARRIRNSLIHGGPVTDETAEAVGSFVEWLAADALHRGIQGYLSDEDVIDHFIDQREAQQRCLARLKNDEPPVNALFWAVPPVDA